MAAEFHLAEDALALHLPLKHLEGLVDIVVTEPVSTWVQEIFEFLPRQPPRLVTKLKMPPRP